MALSSGRLLFLPRLREQRHINRYRQHLLEGNILTRSTPLLPHLERLPLVVRPLAPPDGTPGPALSLARALLSISRLRIVSPPHTGRALTLRQLCLHWAYNPQLLGSRVPLLLPLPALRPQPADALLDVIRRAGLGSHPLALKRGISSGQWVLLLDGWEHIDYQRRTLWRDWLSVQAERYPALTAAVVTGPGEEPWPGFEDWLVEGLEEQLNAL